MAAIAHLLTLARIAELLGEDEDLLHEISIEMEPEDGVIGVHRAPLHGIGDDYTPVFTDFGIENLRERIELHKADAHRMSDIAATKLDPGS